MKLRRVKWFSNYDRGEGWFHRWMDSFDGREPTVHALVELENGSMKHVDYFIIEFINPPEQESK